ncbi:hypothetical protein Nepgr_028307 [Nepenthes gracilis]|uniref:Uncharacterized protein n=1 Tax=Nepenthes gracilis TaxID=150966 RepID=A0AAD3TCL2_NEPGR|nr:hypothetical protein Nepgr_028307 [Nepenthes gracilis]
MVILTSLEFLLESRNLPEWWNSPVGIPKGMPLFFQVCQIGDSYQFGVFASVKQFSRMEEYTGMLMSSKNIVGHVNTLPGMAHLPIWVFFAGMEGPLPKESPPILLLDAAAETDVECSNFLAEESSYIIVF